MTFLLYKPSAFVQCVDTKLCPKSWSWSCGQWPLRWNVSLSQSGSRDLVVTLGCGIQRRENKSVYRKSTTTTKSLNYHK